VQGAASAALAAAVYAITRRLSGTTAATIAGGLVALHPGLIVYDTHKIHPLSFDALAIALTVVLLLRVREAMTAPAALLAGAAFGIALLQRGTMMIVPAAAVTWLAIAEPRGRPRLSRLAFAYALGALLILTPWVARTWAVLGIPTLSTVGAESLWRGNAPHSSGGSYVRPGRTVLEEAPALWEALQGRTELEQEMVFRDAFVADVRQHPGRFAGAIARKFMIFWSFSPVSGVLYPAAYLYIYAAYYAAIVGLAVGGAWLLLTGRSERPESRVTLGLIVSVLLCVSLVQSVFYVELRHRWGVEPLVLAVSAVAVARLWTSVRHARPALAEARR
jgi:4-amino-4-deoxy-L-arabinose transferase-like glycosyltransferase